MYLCLYLKHLVACEVMGRETLAMEDHERKCTVFYVNQTLIQETVSKQPELGLQLGVGLTLEDMKTGLGQSS